MESELATLGNTSLQQTKTMTWNVNSLYEMKVIPNALQPSMEAYHTNQMQSPT